MSDATHGLPVYRPDPDFGRSYRLPDEVEPSFRLPQGWWITPLIGVAVAGWAALLLHLMF